MKKVRNNVGSFIYFSMILLLVPNVWAEYYGKSYALIVGIDKYKGQNWEKLLYAKKDAESMTDF